MKLALLSPHFPPRVSGLADYTARLAAALRDAGVEVIVVVLGQDDADDLPGVEILLHRRVTTLSTVFSLRSTLAELGADAIVLQFEAHAYDLCWQPHLIPLALQRRGGPPVVVTYHELWPPRRLKRVAKGALLNLPHAIVVSTTWHATGVARFRRRGRPPVVVPVGSNIPVDEAGDRRLVRAAHDISAEERLLVYFGFVQPEHRVLELLEAVKIVRSERQDVSIQLIGPFDPTRNRYHATLREVASDPALRDAVTFHGRLEDPMAVARLLRLSDLAVLPYSDGVGENNGSYAAMALAKVPVLTTRGSRSDDIERAGAACFSDGTADAMASAILGLLDDRAQLASVAGRASDRARDASWDQIARAYLDVLEGRP